MTSGNASQSDSDAKGDPGPSSLVEYYARRATEYERIYEKPERRADILALKQMLPAFVAGRDVLEIACGTGYWTQVIAPAANRIFATDINNEVLEIARGKDLGGDRVRFEMRDAFSLGKLPYSVNAGIACFWWSHVSKRHIPQFLHHWHQALEPESQVVFVDNRFVSGSSTPLSRTDADGNSYQQRHLSDGSRYEVMKNFPTSRELTEMIAGMADSVQVKQLNYYWVLSYRTLPHSNG